jgi:hypothetical protein
VEINLEPRKEENYILIIGGTNLKYIDPNKKIYARKDYKSSTLDFLNYFSQLLNTKIAIIENQNTYDNHAPYECVNNCPAGYYKDITNKICYKGGCPDNAYATNNFECIYECKNITNPSSLGINEGYILEKEEDDKKYCYSSCLIL